MISVKSSMLTVSESKRCLIINKDQETIKCNQPHRNTKPKEVKTWKEKKKSKNTQRDFSGGPLVKTRSFQRRECGFDLWVSSRILCGEVKIGYKAMETTGNINNETGPGTNGCTGQCWFKKFCKEDKSLEGERNDWPLEVEKFPKNSTSTILQSFSIWSKLERWKR